MATIVNARDVLLQASATRVANVSMAPNLVVSQSQVEGLGLAIEGSKTVKLVASTQVFQIAKTGTVTPASSTLTVYVNNLTANPTLSVTSGTISPAPTLTNGTVTIAHGSLTTDTATLRVSVTEGGKTYIDEVTLVKVREGNDSLNGFLTNENHTFPASATGGVLSYAGANGTFRVFQGMTDITTLCTFSVVSNPSNLTLTMNSATGAYVISGGFPNGTDVTTVTFRAVFGAANIDKILSLAKSRAGDAGVRGSRTFYVALTGSTATWSDSLATTSVTNAAGSVVLNDTVTQHNSSVGFSQTRFWDGSAWVVVNAVLDGNLLVNGTIGANKISTTSLSAIQASLGTVQIDSGGHLRTLGATAFNSGNGVWMGQDAGVYKFRVGNPTGNKLEWDGTTCTFTGSLNVKSAATGARVEITNQLILVYDSNNVLRVRLGVW
jgi:hypothetical protein